MAALPSIFCVRCGTNQIDRSAMSAIKFYEYMQTPPFWVAHDEDGYWLVPVKNGGWHERSPFVGRAGVLREINDFRGVDLDCPPTKSE